MPPTSSSRYRFTSGIRDDAGRLFLTEREPFGFCEFGDTGRHTVVQGDTLWGLAGLYFAPLQRACGFWWVIADFQPDPIVDGSVLLYCFVVIFGRTGLVWKNSESVALSIGMLLENRFVLRLNLASLSLMELFDDSIR